MAVQSSGILSLYAIGNSTGIVVDIGNRLSVTPISNGYLLAPAVVRSGFGGLSLTESLATMLHGQANNVETVVKLKEEHCFVTPDPSAAALDTRRRNYLGQSCGSELWRCPELLFQPKIAGKSLPEQIFAAVAGCEIDLRRTLLKNIVLSGGTTCFPGFPARLQAEIQRLLDGGFGDLREQSDSASSSQSVGSIGGWKARVVAPPNRKFLPWFGGSKLSQLD
eukprot:SAG31_NODE_17586_length_665_cov_1.143110_1_plen_221_part_11